MGAAPKAPKTRPQYSLKFKKDALWKPLIRLFRRFLKKDAITKETHLSILKQPIETQGLFYC